MVIFHIVMLVYQRVSAIEIASIVLESSASLLYVSMLVSLSISTSEYLCQTSEAGKIWKKYGKIRKPFQYSVSSIMNDYAYIIYILKFY